MRSAVPLPCLFDVVKSQNVAGQRPQQGTKSCRMGRNSVRTYVRPPSGWPSDPAGWPSDPAGWLADHSSCPLDLEGQLEASEGLMEGSMAWPEGSEGQPVGSKGQPKGRTYGCTDVRTYVCMVVQTYRRTDGISPHSTGVCPLLRPLPKK